MRCSLAVPAVLLRSNATFLEVYSGTPPPARVLSVFGSKSCSRCGLAYMCSPDHGFYRLDRPLALSGPKVCTIITIVACTFRKRLLKPTQSSNCALRLTLLSFSLWFCSAFKTYCKTRATIKSVAPKRYILHTVSNHARFSSFVFFSSFVSSFALLALLC